MADVREPGGDASGKQAGKKRTYIPAKGSGGYGILIALIKAEKELGALQLSKADLISLAQPFSDKSYTKPKPGTWFTAWNAIKTLTEKHEYVRKERHRAASYELTDEGRDLALKMYQLLDGPAKETSKTEEEPKCDPTEVIGFQLQAGTYDIILCVDSREQHNGAVAMKKTALISEFEKQGIQCEMRCLPVGDFCWIARYHSETESLYDLELVLDFIMERKRMDDLASSIIDKRWKEQKFRLKNCGIRKPSYLIEEFGPGVKMRCSLPFPTLQQAVFNAQIVDGFDIRYTKDLEHTISYLSTFTKVLKSHFVNRSITVCERKKLVDGSASRNEFMLFSEFKEDSKKVTNFTCKEMFMKTLLQLRGMSVPKVLAVTNNCSTLPALFQAYEECPPKQRKNMFAKLEVPDSNMRLGPSLSAKMFKFYQSD